MLRVICLDRGAISALAQGSISPRYAPGGGVWAAFSSGTVEAHPTLEYQKIKGDKTYVAVPWLWRPLGNCPACPVLNPALGNWGGGGGGYVIRHPASDAYRVLQNVLVNTGHRYSSSSSLLLLLAKRILS